MRFATVCSGIEACSVAWEPLGWEPVFFSEIEKWQSELLSQKYPNIPNHGDMTKFKEWPNYEKPIELICGGTPCQSFSVAGFRKGLNDPRGSLMLTYVSLIAKYRPRWFVWENVPGSLSSGEGRDFATLLGAFSGRSVKVPKNGWKSFGVLSGIPEAYGLAWRVLDSQYVRSDGFGRAVPQRRRRVFLIGRLGGWRDPFSVLFEKAAMGLDIPKRLGERNYINFAPSAISRGFGERPNRSGIIGTLQKSGSETRPAFITESGEARYITPLETERCQGFPDHYTNIPWLGKNSSPDQHRYGSLGNSMSVNTMRWLGERISIVDELRYE